MVYIEMFKITITELIARIGAENSYCSNKIWENSNSRFSKKLLNVALKWTNNNKFNFNSIALCRPGLEILTICKFQDVGYTRFLLHICSIHFDPIVKKITITKVFFYRKINFKIWTYFQIKISHFQAEKTMCNFVKTGQNYAQIVISTEISIFEKDI